MAKAEAKHVAKPSAVEALDSNIRLRVLTLYKRVNDCHNLTFTELSRLADEIRVVPEMAAMADVVLVLKAMVDLVKDLRTELEKAQGKYETATCWQFLQGSMTEPIRTDWSTSTPYSKTLPKLPSRSKEPEAYAKLAEALGVPRDLVDSGAFQPHWPSLVEYCSQLEKEGKALPEGIDVDATKSQYALRSLSRCDLDELVTRHIGE